MDAVEKQYTKWIYPIPVEDMRSAIAEGSYWEIGDPLLYQPLFWPRRRDADNLDILIAGCGSVQAAYYACRNPSWNVIGIDISDSSLAHQEKLKERHGLSNLRLEKLEITEVSKLGETYDFIVSTGVLHHLPNPQAGLEALKDVLRPQGVINLMVYGRSLRLGVYMMQEVFRLLEFEQTQEDVDIVKATIAGLPSDHVVKRYTRNAGDLHYDAAFVDTFLHPRDRAFKVNEIFELTRAAGLEFLTWCDPGEYSLESLLPAAHPLWRKLRNLPPELEAHICDLLTQSRGTHRWAAAHADYVREVRIPFETDEFFDCTVIPHRLTKIIQQGDASKNQNVMLQRRGYHYELHFQVGEILARTNGARSIRQAVSEMSLAEGDRQDLLLMAKRQFHALWRQGHIYILLPHQPQPVGK